MNKSEFLLNYKQMIPQHVCKVFEADLDSVIKEEAYPNIKKGDVEICGKCGTVI